MTDREKIEQIWQYIERRMGEIGRGDDEFDWGMKEGFSEVLNLIDDLVY